METDADKCKSVGRTGRWAKAMKGGREREMDELWSDCGELHNYTLLYQSYFDEKESASSLTDRVRNNRK